MKKKPLVLASELVGGMNFDVASGTQSSLICAAYDSSWSSLADITLNLHDLIRFERKNEKEARTKRRYVVCGGDMRRFVKKKIRVQDFEYQMREI